MIRKTAAAGFAGLALAVLALAGCGGGTTSAPAASSAPAPAGAASSAGDSPGAGSGSTGASGTAPVGDPCHVLDADAIRRLTGVAVQQGTSQSVSSSTVCTWLPKDKTADGAAVLSGQEGPLPGPLDQVADALKSQFDGTVSPLTVSGAEDARYLTGSKSGLDIIDVVASKGGVFFQVIVAAPRDAGRHKDGAVKVVEALLAA